MGSRLNRCPKCGTRLIKIDENLICPNHGIIDGKIPESDEENLSYIS